MFGHSFSYSPKLFLSIATVAVSGCAIHPLPEDYAPLDTVEVVSHLRCEMYAAVRHQIVLIFKQSSHPEAKRIAAELESNPSVPVGKFRDKVHLLDAKYQTRVKSFRGTTIGYGFRFNITEQNVANSEVNLGVPWNSLTNFKLKATTGLDKKRANTRRFFKVDTFEELLESNDCLAAPLRSANYVYPITGTIGLKDTVDDFIELTTSGARTDAEAKDVKNFSEQLTYTTQLSGGLNPKLTLAPVTDHFRLADAAVNASATRIDVHEVTITFAVSRDFTPRGLALQETDRRDAVIQELNNLRILDAVERGGIVVP